MKLILLLRGCVIDCLVVTVMPLACMAADPGGHRKTARHASIVGSELFPVGNLLLQHNLWLQDAWTTVICS